MSDVTMMIHDVEGLEVIETEKNYTSGGRVFYSRQIKIKTEKIAVNLTLFSDDKEKLK